MKQRSPISSRIPAFVLVGSLFALIAAGCQHSDRVKLAVSVLAGLLFVSALIKAFTSTDFSSSQLVNGTPKQLAWIRILVCLTAFILTVMEDLPAFSRVPADFRLNDHFFHLLNSFPGYTTLVSNQHLLAILQWTTAILLLLGMVGLKTRITLPLAGLCYFMVQAIIRHYTWFCHTGLVPVYLLLLLPWTPCAAAWSLDRLVNPAKSEPSRQQSFGFSVYACFTVMAIVYLFCGLSKMRDSGLAWFRGENIQHDLLEDAMNLGFLNDKWNATLWLVQHDAPGFVYGIIGFVGVGVELGYFTVLFSRTARIVMPILAFGLHLGIMVFQHILFLDLLILQLVFLNADRLAAFAARHFHFRAARAAFRIAPNNGDAQRALPRSALASMAVVVAGLFVIWVFRIEYYPFSAWQLYTRSPGKVPIFYYKIMATLEDGRSIIVPRRDYCLAVMPSSSGFATLIKTFREPWRTGSFGQFLSAYVERRNRQLAFGSRISAIEVQRWRWNYAVDPHDPHLGWISHRYVYDAVARQSFIFR